MVRCGDKNLVVLEGSGRDKSEDTDTGCWRGGGFEGVNTGRWRSMGLKLRGVNTGRWRSMGLEFEGVNARCRKEPKLDGVDTSDVLLPWGWVGDGDNGWGGGLRTAGKPGVPCFLSPQRESL